MIAALISATLALLSSIGSEITLVFGIPLVVLEAGLLGVVFRHGLARRFWIGFEVFGWLSWTCPRDRKVTT